MTLWTDAHHNHTQSTYYYRSLPTVNIGAAWPGTRGAGGAGGTAGTGGGGPWWEFGGQGWRRFGAHTGGFGPGSRLRSGLVGVSGLNVWFGCGKMIADGSGFLTGETTGPIYIIRVY